MTINEPIFYLFSEPLSIILWALLAALLSVAYHAQLIRPGHLLSGWHKLLVRGEKALDPSIDAGWFQWRIHDLYCFITKSTRECAWCLSGQLALLHHLLLVHPEATFLYWFTTALHVGAAIVLSTYIMNRTTHAIRTT